MKEKQSVTQILSDIQKNERKLIEVEKSLSDLREKIKKLREGKDKK